jgi:hypothetical protein
MRGGGSRSCWWPARWCASTGSKRAEGVTRRLTITAPTQRRRWSLRCLGPVPRDAYRMKSVSHACLLDLLGPTRSSALSNLHGRWPPFPDGPSPIGVVARVDLLYRWVRDSLHPSTGGPNPTAQTASCSLSVIQSRWVRRDRGPRSEARAIFAPGSPAAEASKSAAWSTASPEVPDADRRPHA